MQFSWREEGERKRHLKSLWKQLFVFLIQKPGRFCLAEVILERLRSGKIEMHKVFSPYSRNENSKSISRVENWHQQFRSCSFPSNREYGKNADFCQLSSDWVLKLKVFQPDILRPYVSERRGSFPTTKEYKWFWRLLLETWLTWDLCQRQEVSHFSSRK